MRLLQKCQTLKRVGGKLQRDVREGTYIDLLMSDWYQIDFEFVLLSCRCHTGGAFHTGQKGGLDEVF